MKKDKKITAAPTESSPQKSSFDWKNIFIYSLLILLLAAALFILGYRYVYKTTEQQPFVYQKPAAKKSSTTAPSPTTSSTPVSVPPILAPEHDVTIQLLHQLIAFEILQEVLKGDLPLTHFTLYLQKQEQPWATEILEKVAYVKEVVTWNQLQELLSEQPASRHHSLWSRIKHKIKSIIKIRKLGTREKDGAEIKHKIQEALRTHHLQQAIDYFKALSPQEQASLSLWYEKARDRLIVETIKQKLLLGISEK